jgi:hypothetical protein
MCSSLQLKGNLACKPIIYIYSASLYFSRKKNESVVHGTRGKGSAVHLAHVHMTKRHSFLPVIMVRRLLKGGLRLVSLSLLCVISYE